MTSDTTTLLTKLAAVFGIRFCFSHDIQAMVADYVDEYYPGTIIAVQLRGRVILIDSSNMINLSARLDTQCGGGHIDGNCGWGDGAPNGAGWGYLHSGKGWGDGCGDGYSDGYSDGNDTGPRNHDGHLGGDLITRGDGSGLGAGLGAGGTSGNTRSATARRQSQS